MNAPAVRTVIASAAVVMLACNANPTVPEPSLELHAELEFSAAEIMTLTQIEVEVTVQSDAPGVFTDMARVALERRMDGVGEWRATELTPHEDHFSGELMFPTSGEYEIRVVGEVAGSSETLVLYQAAEHLHVERIYEEVGDYVIQFETFPGHLHEGQTAEVVFWVLEAGADGHAHGHGVAGLGPEIVCTDPSGAVEEHHAHAHAEGEYGTEHTFLEAGTAHFELHFTDGAGVDRHAEFSAPVSHAH